MPGFELVVDDREVVRLLRRAEEGVRELPEKIARAVAEEATEESRSRGITWRPRTEPDLAAEAEQWWAHFLARGTRPHGPRRAPRLRLLLGGGEVGWAMEVAGVRADPFHERAISRARTRLEELAREVLG
ncbi:MAG TPA: hypothetical protein VNO79_01415 [Actinomycetota bacterium]|nr:hypothetical protein [Actinomycetota bacterium]